MIRLCLLLICGLCVSTYATQDVKEIRKLTIEGRIKNPSNEVTLTVIPERVLDGCERDYPIEVTDTAGTFSQEILRFPGNNTLQMVGQNESGESPTGWSELTVGDLVVDISWPAVYYDINHMPSSLFKGYLPGMDSWVGDTHVTNAATGVLMYKAHRVAANSLHAGLYSIRVKPGSADVYGEGRIGPESTMVTVSVSFNGEQVFCRSVSVLLDRVWDVTTIVVHKPDQTGAYQVTFDDEGFGHRDMYEAQGEPVKIEGVPVILTERSDYLIGTDDFCAVGENGGKTEVFLEVGESVQLQAKGSYLNAPELGATKSFAGLGFFTVEDVSSNSDATPPVPPTEYVIDELGVLTVLSPGHLQIGCKYGTSKKLDVYALEMNLIPDFNHDRVIDDADKALLATNGPFRFWINDDNDFTSNAEQGNDWPGQAGAPGDADCPDWETEPLLGGQFEIFYADGIRDWIDFFPVKLDISSALDVLPASEYAYVVKHSATAFNGYIETGLSSGDAGNYLIEETYCEEHENVILEPIDADGHTLSAEFLDGVENQDRDVILLEARVATQSPLVLEIRRKTDDTVICRAEMAVSINGVEEMFRHKNLRDITGGAGGETDRLGDPSNNPDALGIGKNFVFIHGYNNNGEDGRAAQCEIFKRMYWSGSRARFYGISWYGDDSQIPIIEAAPNYQTNVIHALDTAPFLSEFLKTLQGETSVAAHSLGNVLTSSAISKYGAPVTTYFIINGAVAMEAFNPAQTTEWDMVNQDWGEYLTGGSGDFLLASEWYKLFPASDPRSKLTWHGVFQNMPGTARYNFYSPQEDVVGNIPHDQGNLIEALTFAWGGQEKLKGRMPYGYIGGSSQMGWGYNRQDYGSWENDAWGTPQWTREPVVNALAIPTNELVTQPFFLKDPTALFSNDESTSQSFASNGYNWLMAKAIPAQTFAMAANSNETLISVEMPTALRNGWYQDNIEWGHSSFKNVAYVYTYLLYERIAGLGGLR